MPLSPKQQKCLANHQSTLLQYTRQREARGLQLRTKQRVEAVHEEDRERKRRAILKEQRVVQRALLKEQRNYFLKIIGAIILAFSAAIVFLQHLHQNHIKDDNLF